MNKHLHIVTPKWGWWSDWARRNLIKYLSDRCEITHSDSSNPEADLNFHITWWAREGREKTKIDVAHFTHLNPIYEFDVTEALQFHDHYAAVTNHGKQVLIEHGVPAKRITVIMDGVDGFAPRKLNVGISGMSYTNYRKREYLLAELWWRMKPGDFYSLHFIFLGPNWDNIVNALKAQGASVSYPKDLPFEKYPEMFAAFDVYVNCAFAEGGPMGVIQGLACGIPVLSPKQGYGYDLNTLHFEDAEGLAAHLEMMIRRPQYTRTWKDWAEDHWNLFERLWG